jgi:F-type H+-transporting ATPase subunit b
MLIDWFTVAAQVVNFLLLLYLLKRFLYRPILRAMDKREQGIADRLAEAEKARHEAEQLASEYQRKSSRLEAQRSQLLGQAEADAEQHKKQLLAQARDATEELRNGWVEALQREQAQFLGELKQRLGAEVVRICRKSTNELAGVDLQPGLVAVLLEKLQGVAAADKEKCRLAASQAVPDVRSTFPLKKPLEEKITSALHDLCGSRGPVSYKADPTMPFGIEVTLGELRIAWGIERYFKELEENIAGQLAQSRQSTSSQAGVQGHD